MLKAILQSNGQVVAEKELVAVARFSSAVYLDGGFYILHRIEGTKAIYRAINYYRFPDTPIEEDEQFDPKDFPGYYSP
ncbi:hypothetical protein [Nostoc sp. PCC 7107]|uniref:hypothetical protein n=1 Tax=Nostoc sp. PCC 7107 TaxID=317936 RepID=UPI00029F4CD7|nr:hypothetical protein [Nostoc sp. PCC 7107]AFY43641.1 hypothetical protein Nos7107_3050 [Nostoc sp. PCC 7107]